MKLRSHEIEERASALREISQRCCLCPRHCRVDRTLNHRGFCGAEYLPEIASYQPHFGEEAPLVGRFGSGTVFFYHCNLGCVFCQNDSISQGSGRAIDIEDLARLFLRVQNENCHNLNLVTPTHYVHAIVEALVVAREAGLNIPVVYNCSGYESPTVLELLRDIVDIYMPDIKTLDQTWAKQHLHAPDYPDVVTEALKIMFQQVGNLKLNEQNIAEKGLLIRHLVMPGQIRDTCRIIDLVAKVCGTDAYLNLMPQYRPCFQAYKYDELTRRITPDEWRDATNYLRQIGIIRGLES